MSNLPPLEVVLLRENVKHSLALLAFLPSIATVLPLQTYIAMSALRSLILTFRIISGLQSQPLRVFFGACMKVESEMLMRTVKIRPTRPKPRTLHISHPHHSISTHGCNTLQNLGRPFQCICICSIPTNNSRVQSAPQSILVSEWCLVTHERKFERFRQRGPAHLNDQDQNRRYTRFVVGGRDSYIRGSYDGLWSSKTM